MRMQLNQRQVMSHYLRDKSDYRQFTDMSEKAYMSALFYKTGRSLNLITAAMFFLPVTLLRFSKDNWNFSELEKKLSIQYRQNFSCSFFKNIQRLLNQSYWKAVAYFSHMYSIYQTKQFYLREVIRKFFQIKVLSITAFACKAKRFGFASFFFFCRTFPEYRGIRGKKIIYGLSNTREKKGAGGQPLVATKILCRSNIKN